MTICLVTDRRRRPILEQCRHAVDAGIDFIQVRERDLDAAALAALVADLVGLTRRTSTRVLVNDRVDVALACGADGVHLRGDSVPPSAARAMAPPGFLVGQSVHGVDEALSAAAHVDYLIAGTVFESASKPGPHPVLGLGGLDAIARAVTVPVLAIGGLSSERIPLVAATEAAGIAAIGLFTGTAASLVEMVARARALWAGAKQTKSPRGPGVSRT